eukprot:TRINITY_DN101349_c0_g1_i1.p1 TRINITY_DN101349_c0_g1~~TRINITY_DN101349_c0_g1_i1.p1  ORF type:complete len:199 (-),score=44.38 TRINITY_DN101349_c0_g1_i1:361-957(-)
MGCSGSALTPKDAEAKIQGDYRVYIDRTEDNKREPLGMTLIDGDGGCLVVAAIDDMGMVSSWNQQNKFIVAVNVRPGDIVLAANGISGPAKLMKAKMRQRSSLVLVMKYGEARALATAVATSVWAEYLARCSTLSTSTESMLADAADVVADRIKRQNDTLTTCASPFGSGDEHVSEQGGAGTAIRLVSPSTEDTVLSL